MTSKHSQLYSFGQRPESWPAIHSLNLEATYNELRHVDDLDKILASHKDAGECEKEEEDLGSYKHRSQAWLAAACRIDNWRTTLRARAMDLSRSSSTRLSNILDLPLDIFHQIFRHFRDEDISCRGKINWRIRKQRDEEDARRHDLQNARLVCRLFNQIASLLLFPILLIELDQTSIDRAKRVINNPLLAAGIRGIQVALAYRPRELATNISRFKDSRKKDLVKMARWCDQFLQRLDWDDEYTASKPSFTACENAMDAYEFTCWAWDDYLKPTRGEVDDEAQDEDIRENQRILQQCHEEYRQKHQEQLQLILSGSFVEAVASIMAQLRHSVSLGIVDQVDTNACRHLENPTLLTDREELRRFMVTPHSWGNIEELDGGVELIPARILSELPIAIHKAGVPLRHLDIGCFPTNPAGGNFSMICPGGQSRGQSQGLQSPHWSAFHDACQQLEEPVFGKFMVSVPPRFIHVSAEDQAYVDQYLRSIFSGQNLREVTLDMSAFGRRNEDTIQFSWNHIGSVLGMAKWPNVRRLNITALALTQTELEGFCSGLGDNLEKVDFSSVELLGNGSWVGALDTLRLKVAPRCLKRECKVTLSLTGGEFGSFHFDSADERYPEMLELANKYVSGIEEENPVRGNGIGARGLQKDGVDKESTRMLST